MEVGADGRLASQALTENTTSVLGEARKRLGCNAAKMIYCTAYETR